MAKKRIDSVQEHSEKWDMSDERAFMENLLNKRFNFFLIFYSLIVGGYLNAKESDLHLIILILGAVITIPLAITIARAGRRLKIIINDHLYHNSRHPVKIIKDQIKGPSVRWIIAYAIPAFCCTSLLAGILCWFLSILK